MLDINIEDKKIDSYLKNAEILLPAVDLLKIDFAKAENLKWLHVTSAGVNNLPKAILNSNILVTNSSGVHPIPIAEQIFAYMLIFARDIKKTTQAQLQKKWISHTEIKVFELEGKTLGIIGLGRIGENVAKLAKAFNMKVLAITKTKRKKSNFVDQQFTITKLDELLKKSDFVINCLPSTSQTLNMFDFKKFRIMKPSSYFINIGRGTTVVENDLIKALKNKLIAGAGLDVFEEESLPSKSPLWEMQNVIITPHHAGLTPHYMDRVIEIFLKNLKAYLLKTPMPNLVDKKLGY